MDSSDTSMRLPNSKLKSFALANFFICKKLSALAFQIFLNYFGDEYQ